MAADYEYEVFISYSRDPADHDVAVQLQDELQRFARPWYQPRARTVRVYRDQTNLPPSPDLWGTLEQAISSSRWLVLVASPRSAHSEGVRREVDWWRQQRGSADICIALADGELRWDDARNDFDWASTSALPRESLEHAFTHEPNWIDLRPVTQGDDPGRRRPWQRFTRSLADPRWQDAAASLIAEIKDVPKDTLIGEHLRRSRQTRRAVTSTLIVLILLLAASVTAGLIARSQRDQAVRQATISEAGQLAAIAETLTGSHLDLAGLFAAQAYRLHPDAQTSAALFSAVTADPHLVRYLPASGTVSAVATSADGRTAVAGTVGGDLLRWNLRHFGRSVVATMPAGISSVAVSADGDTIAATDGSAALVGVQGVGVQHVSLAAGWKATATGVSGTGRYIAFGEDSPAGQNWLTLINERTGRSVTARADVAYPVEELGFSGETQLVALDTDGHWERLAVPSLAEVSASSANFGAHDFAQAMSATGTYISFTNGGPPLDVYNTVTTPTSELSPPMGAGESGDEPTALALSADGRVAADADSGTIYVSDISTFSKASSATLLALRGNTAINPGTLTFVGDSDSELLSASSSSLTLWNLNQDSRISSAAAADIPSACNACAGPAIYPSPDSGHTIITADSGGAALIASLPPSAHPIDYFPGSNTGNITYGSVLWSANSRNFSILTPSDGGGQFWVTAGKRIRNWATTAGSRSLADTGFDAPVALLSTADGKEMVELDVAGNIIVRNSRTGAVERQVAGPVKPEDGDLNAQDLGAVDPQAEYAAVVVPITTGIDFSSKVDVVDIRTGAITQVRGGAALGVAYDGEQLVIQRTDGTFEVRSADGRRLIRSFAGDMNTSAGPAVSRSGLIVDVNSDGTAPVFDISSGQEIGSLQLPAGPRNNSTSIAFTPDGKDVVTATEGDGTSADPGTVTEWSFSPSNWSTIACTSAGHALTMAEWQQYVGTGPAMPSQLACRS
jgi:WD40 repeat protein